MTSRYNVQAVERKWQQSWAEKQSFKATEDSARRKYYVMSMFPYPSGRIHMGHVRNYTLGDVVARYKRAQGFNVLHPMGWDAFGLPAENAARERKIHPAQWTYDNIKTMRGELKRMGLAIDWDREFATCDPTYYKHQQKLFLDFLKAGLAYRKESWVNWDPVDQTVLANEQVIEGRGWRSGAVVEKRKLSQWFLKITGYADELLTALGTLDRWPEKVRLMQENWIGRSAGAKVRFEIKGTENRGQGDEQNSLSLSLFPHRNLHHPPGHPLRRFVHRTFAQSSAGGGAGEKGYEARFLHRGMQPQRYFGSDHRSGGEKRLRHRAQGAARVRRKMGIAGLCRQFRFDGIRHRRHFRLPRARPARSRFRAQI